MAKDTPLGGERWRLALAGGTRLTVECADGAVGREVLVAVRPQRLSLHAPGARPEALNCLEGWVVRATYLGERTDCWVEVSGVGELRVQLATGTAPAAGSAVTVAFHPGDVRVVASGAS